MKSPAGGSNQADDAFAEERKARKEVEHIVENDVEEDIEKFFRPLDADGGHFEDAEGNDNDGGHKVRRKKVVRKTVTTITRSTSRRRSFKRTDDIDDKTETAAGSYRDKERRGRSASPARAREDAGRSRPVTTNGAPAESAKIIPIKVCDSDKMKDADKKSQPMVNGTICVTEKVSTDRIVDLKARDPRKDREIFFSALSPKVCPPVHVEIRDAASSPATSSTLPRRSGGRDFRLENPGDVSRNTAVDLNGSTIQDIDEVDRPTFAAYPGLAKSKSLTLNLNKLNSYKYYVPSPTSTRPFCPPSKPISPNKPSPKSVAAPPVTSPIKGWSPWPHQKPQRIIRIDQQDEVERPDKFLTVSPPIRSILKKTVDRDQTWPMSIVVTHFTTANEAPPSEPARVIASWRVDMSLRATRTMVVTDRNVTMHGASQLVTQKDHFAFECSVRDLYVKS